MKHIQVADKCFCQLLGEIVSAVLEFEFQPVFFPTARIDKEDDYRSKGNNQRQSDDDLAATPRDPGRKLHDFFNLPGFGTWRSDRNAFLIEPDQNQGSEDEDTDGVANPPRAP